MTLGPLCAPCPLKAAGGRGYAVSRGTLKHGVMLVAEALGKEEADQGKPLVGSTGQLTNRMINRTPDPISGRLLSDEDFLMTNIIRCQPPGNLLKNAPYERGAIETCSPYLEELIRETKPRAILTLGDTPLQWFTGQSGITSLRGYAFSTKYGAVVPTYHPAYLLRGKHNLATIWIMDLLKALAIARNNGVIPKHEGEYTPHPTPIQAAMWVRDFMSNAKEDTLLSFDLETPHSDEKDEDWDGEPVLEDDPSYTILMCSLAWQDKKAISLPWMPPYIDLIKQVMAHPCIKVGWNCRSFDIPRLVANGATVNGKVIDGMDAWHFLFPAFPMGLKYVATFYRPDVGAWKLEAKRNLAWYNCVDADVTLSCINGILKTLKDQGRLDVFMRHFVELSHVLGRMTKRGVPVDQVRRKESRERFEKMYDEQLASLQPLVSDDLKPKKVYKKSGEEGEAWLRKKGSWVEGRMTKVKQMEKEPKRPKRKSSTDGESALKPSKERKVRKPRQSKKQKPEEKLSPTPSVPSVE